MSLDIRSFIRAAWSFVGLEIRPSADIAGPTITSGTGAPASAEPNGSVYLRTDGAGGSTVYERVAGAWVALEGVSDDYVLATVAVADAPGGATGALATVTLTNLDGTPLTSARQVFLVSSTTQYGGEGAPIAGITIGSVTAGSVIATISTSNFLVQTDATGVFAATISNSADQTVYFAAINPKGGVSDITKAAVVVGSNVDAAIWSA